MAASEVFVDPVVKEIVGKARSMWGVEHALSLMGWDSRTYMPRGGVEERGIARAELIVLRRRLLLDPEFVRLVEKAEDSYEGLNVYEKGLVRVLRRRIRIEGSLPEKLVYERARITEEAVAVWEKAKAKGDFEAFKPYLERIVELSREIAEHLGYEEHPYDALLDLYEEGLTTRRVESLFDAILPTLKAALEKVRSSGYYPERHPLEEVEYQVPVMDKVNREVLTLIGFPWDRGRLDVSAHPFTISMGIGDVRITTRYEGRDFRHTMYAVIHEFGHALYELQIDEALKATPLASGVSLGVHESQSRFWENVVGRSMAFVEAVSPLLRRHLGFLEGYSDEELYRYFNIVRPGPIRVEADELTYNFHIYLRFKIEKELIEGSLRVDEVPEVWNRLMEELLGVKPRSHSEGVLQDIHWSSGAIGYFPTYTIGTVLAAQILYRYEAVKGGFYEAIRSGDFAAIREYLREAIHRWGSTFKPDELVERGLGEPLNPEYYNRYITRKFVELKLP